MKPEKLLEINTTQLRQEGSVDRSVDSFVSLSPYDIPQALSGRFEAGGKSVVVQVEYLTTDEPTKRMPYEEGFITQGKKSGLIYSLEVPNPLKDPAYSGPPPNKIFTGLLHAHKSQESKTFISRARVDLLEDLIGANSDAILPDELLTKNLGVQST